MNQIVRYYAWLRWIMIGGEILGIGIIVAVFRLDIPWIPVGLVLAGMIGATLWILQTTTSSTDFMDSLIRHLVLDVSALFVLVYLTGGSMNPFISLFVLPVVFSAATQSLRRTMAIAMLAVGAYTLLMFFHRPIDFHQLHVSGATLHLWGMWYGFVLVAVCITALVARMSIEIRSRDRELAQAREAALKSDRIVALGTLAAGTAHELGTPLSTMSVLANDLEIEAEDGATKQQLSLLNNTIAQCKEILSRLAADAGQVQANSGRRVQIDHYLSSIIEEWQNSRPDVAVTFSQHGEAPAPELVADRILDQAIINILNNAADATASVVEVTGHWNSETMTLEIVDDGAGIDRHIASNAGERPVKRRTDNDGLGIGLYLAVTALKRFGGKVDFDWRNSGGTSAFITVPLSGITVS